jgi:hypothetical protein
VGSLPRELECGLDRGAPLVCTLGDRRATVSGMNSERECGGGGRRDTNVFLRIAHYSSWIKSRLIL